MPSYLERYLAGEHEEVWAELTALGPAVRGPDLLTDAEAVARETMTRARRNVELLILRLESIGYEFGLIDRERNEYAYKYPGPHQSPDSGTNQQVLRLEAAVGPLPLSLRAWFETVGSVDLRGDHPGWDYAADNYYGDPLVVWFGPDYFLQAYEDWRVDYAEYGPDDAEPFRFELAPDYYHKANISGGPAYGIAPGSGMDAPFLEEWNHGTFVEYLRICFKWGGFPGFGAEWETAKAHEEALTGEPFASHLAILTEGLSPL
jgi:hypothetical protein